MIDTKEGKRAHWANIIKEWKGTGITQSRYCREHNIKPHLLTYWAQVFSQKTNIHPKPNIDNGFVAISVSDNLPASLTLKFPNGLKLEGIRVENLSMVREIIGWSS